MIFPVKLMWMLMSKGVKNMSKVTHLEEVELAIDGAATTTQVFLIRKHILISVYSTAFV